VVAENKGQHYYKRAFNTQACEQLNAWMGGFESVLKKMTISNFDWFLHTMLYYHTRTVLQSQKEKEEKEKEKASQCVGESDEEGSDDNM